MRKEMILLSIILSLNTFAICNPIDIISIPNWMEDYRKECNIENKIVPKPTKNDDINNQKEFNTKVISSFLATKIKQNFEDIASIETYYSSKDKDLGELGGASLLQSCTLNKLNEIEKKCGSKNKKVHELTSTLLGQESSSSLYEVASGLFKKVRRIDYGINSKNSCPLIEGMTSSILSSLFDDAKKDAVLEDIEHFNGGMISDQFDKISLFKILPNNSKEKVLLSLKQKLLTSKNKKQELDSYFTSKEYTSDLAKNLSGKCDSLFKVIESYACDDSDVVSNNQEISKLIFKSNDESTKDLNEQRISAQCRSLRIIEDKSVQSSKVNNTLDKLITNIISDRRPVTKLKIDKQVNGEVCSVYNCKDDEIINLKSCKNGGPISSIELKQHCKEIECTPNIINLIAYLEIYEKEKNITTSLSINSVANKSSSPDLTQNNSSKPKMSTFLENFLGVEGTLSAQGIKPTPEAIAEKVAEFKEKGLDTTTSTSPVAQAAPKAQPMQAADVREAGAGLQNPNANSQANIVASNSNTDYHPLVSSSDASSSIPKVSGRNKSIASASSFGSDNGLNGTDSKSNDMQSMRKQLDEMLDTMKGASANEKLATISDNNGKYLPKSLGGDPTDNGLNEAERKRLADYRDNLNRWEKRLNDREWDITNRQGRSLSSSGNAQGSDGRQNQGPMEASNGGVNSDFSGSSEGRSKAVKLTSKSGDKGAKSLGSSDEATVSSDELTNLGKEKLKELGIDSKSPFMMKIVFNKKVYQVAVKMFNFRGKDILTPILSENNKDISKLVLGSPLFAEYRQYQLDRQKEKAAFSKMTE